MSNQFPGAILPRIVVDVVVVVVVVEFTWKAADDLIAAVFAGVFSDTRQKSQPTRRSFDGVCEVANRKSPNWRRAA